MGRAARASSATGRCGPAQPPAASIAEIAAARAVIAVFSVLRTPGNGRIMRRDLTAEDCDVEDAPSASPGSRVRRAGRRAAGRHLREGHRADPAEVVSELSSARPDGTHVALDLRG